MKTHALTIVSVASSLSLLVCLSACQDGASKPDAKAAGHDAVVGDEVSLKSDRSQYDDLRKDMPEEIKRNNDELAFIRELMKDGDEEPAKIRERFSKAVRDRRDKFDKEAHKRREDFNRREKKDREDFLKRLKQERDTFMSEHKKAKPDERKDFFDEQEAQRTDFFADQKDHRKDFESADTEAHKTFEAYMNEKRNQFEQEARDYSSAYYERRKSIDLKKRMEEKAKAKAKREADDTHETAAHDDDAPARPRGTRKEDKDLDDFKKIPKSPATPLTPPDNY